MDAAGYVTYSPAVQPCDPRWLAPGEGWRPPCGKQHPAEPHYRCSRVLGHEGRHAAHGLGNEMFASWPNDPRYPFTYAADLIRSRGGFGENGVKLSRAEASAILSIVAEATGQDREALACALADHYLRHQEEVDAGFLRGAAPWMIGDFRAFTRVLEAKDEEEDW